MASDGRVGTARVAERIRDYLRHNPNAADTAEGIARWWLGPLTDTVPEEVVAEALDDLAEQGELEARRLPAGVVVYSRPASR